MAPLVPSWLGRGTLSDILLRDMGGGVPAFPLTRPPMLSMRGSAGLGAEEEMKALVTRKGWRAVIGLAVRGGEVC